MIFVQMQITGIVSTSSVISLGVVIVWTADCQAVLLVLSSSLWCVDIRGRWGLITGAIMTCRRLSPCLRRRDVRAAVQTAGERGLHLHQLYRAPPGRVEDRPGEGAAGLCPPRPHRTAQLANLHTPAPLQTGEMPAKWYTHTQTSLITKSVTSILITFQITSCSFRPT